MKALKAIAAVVLALHGLVHLLGTTVYLRLAEIEGLPYKTTVLGGRWDLGEGGIAIFGLLWAAATLGFVVATAMWLRQSAGWRSILLSVTLVSLALTLVDGEAPVGVAVNVLILAILGVGALWARRPVRASAKG
jgi:hypothetical protein